MIQHLDYRKELEKTARQMILIHRMDTLVKVILRTIIRSMRIEHASMLLYDESRDAYVAYSSFGKSGRKIPKGFTRISKDNPIVGYFKYREKHSANGDYLLFSQLDELKDDYSEKLKDQFILYNAKACIPGFFRDKLIFALFLGVKLDGVDFTTDELTFMSILSSDAVMAIQNANLFQDLNEQLARNKTLFLQTIFALSSAVEAKDVYTKGHTERVTKYSQIVAEELKAMKKISGQDTKTLLENLRIASLLHDIGKIGVSEAILNKKDTLNEHERTEVEKHPVIGADMLSKIDELSEPVSGVKYHHERYDGTGYPFGLKGDNIPLIARIISVADAYDAMTTDRPYRKALAKEKAIDIIDKERGKQFDSSIVDAFLNVCKKGEI